METLETIRSRKTIRKFLDRPVEPEKLKAVLEAARLAPSWANMQCWRFVVVQDPALRRRISELAYIESIFAAKGYKTNPSQLALAEAPVVIVACGEPNLSGDSRGQQYYMTDVGLAVENLMLEARSLGLGSGFVGAFDADELGRLLDIPPYISIVGLIPLGYPQEWPNCETPRKPLNEIAFSEKWGCVLEPEEET